MQRAAEIVWRVIPWQWLGPSGESRRARLGRMRQEVLGRATQWKENTFGKWKNLPCLGDDARVSGFQRLSQQPLALPLCVGVAASAWSLRVARSVASGDHALSRDHN